MSKPSDLLPGPAIPDRRVIEVGKRSLVAKLAEVMAAVERVPKRGRNTFHGYDYATEADIASEIRRELAARGVMLIPSIDDMTREAVGEKGQILTILKMTMTFIDGETGETLNRPWMGAGTDKEDKGLYKAMTGGEKYFLLKTFLIPTGDDPERDVAQDDRQKAPAAPKPRSFDAPRPAPQAPAAPGQNPVDDLLVVSAAKPAMVQEIADRAELIKDLKRISANLKLTPGERVTYGNTYLGETVSPAEAELPDLESLVNALRARTGEPAWKDRQK